MGHMGFVRRFRTQVSHVGFAQDDGGLVLHYDGQFGLVAVSLF